MERKWIIRAYKEGDETKIFQLWRAVYPELEHNQKAWWTWWHWTRTENPTGDNETARARYYMLADDHGHIVGQYRLTPMDMKVGDKLLKATQGVDALTHPDYRRQGVFSTLIRHALDETRKGGIDVAISFPVYATISYATHVKSGWLHVANMQSLVKPLNWNRVIGLKVKNGWLRTVLATAATWLFDRILFRAHDPPEVEGLHVDRVVCFDDRINALSAKMSNRHVIMVVRNERYLNWRYGVPEQNYQILVAEKANEVLGYAVVQHAIQHNITVTHVLDLIAQSEEVMHSLIMNVFENSRLNNADLVLYRLIADETHRRILKRNGFISLPFIKRVALVAYSNSSFFSKDFLRNPKNWFVQIGDSDYRLGFW